MTVILVLATFLAFIALDYALNRRTAVVTVPVQRARAAGAHPGEYIAGFQVPADRSYHPGHSWVAEERKNVVRVGVDEFAAALLGKVDKVNLPNRGQWIRQGQTAFSFFRGGKETRMVSPTEGEVLAVNPDLANNLSLLRADPYGAGWLFTLNVPDEETTSRNLVPKRLVGDWMREAVDRLYARQPQLAGAVAADGGCPTEDLGAAFPDADWKELTAEFFLSA